MFFLLLFLIGFRPFLSSLAFPLIDFTYSYIFICLSIFFIIRKKGSFLPNSKTSIFIYLFFISLVISSYFGLNFQNSIIRFYKFIFLLFVYLFASNVNTEEKNSIIRILIISSFLVSLYSLYYFFFAGESFINTLKYHNINYPFAIELLSRKRTFIPFILPSMLSCYLAIGLCLSAGYISSSRKSQKNKVILSSIFLTPIAISLLLTKSISGLFSLILALILCLIVYKESKKKLLLVLLVSITIIAIIYSLRTINSSHFTTVVFSLNRRISYWQEALRYISKHPFKGTGLGNYWGSYSQFVHNSYLQIWVEAGLAGIISLILVIYISIKNVLKNRDFLKHSILLAYLIFLFHNLFDFSFFLPELSFIWWIIIAISNTKKP